MKKVDWDRYVPLGMDGKTVRNRMAAGLGVASGYSLMFVVRYCNAYRNLYQVVGGKRHWLEDAVMAEFGRLLDGTMAGLAVLALLTAAVVAVFYASHYQEGRSIYAMKRLSSPWELWRRCLTMPVCTAIASGLAALALTGIYYAIYMLCTPAAYLPG